MQMGNKYDFEPVLEMISSLHEYRHSLAETADKMEAVMVEKHYTE